MRACFEESLRASSWSSFGGNGSAAKWLPQSATATRPYNLATWSSASMTSGITASNWGEWRSSFQLQPTDIMFARGSLGFVTDSIDRTIRNRVIRASTRDLTRENGYRAFALVAGNFGQWNYNRLERCASYALSDIENPVERLSKIVRTNFSF